MKVDANFKIGSTNRRPKPTQSGGGGEWRCAYCAGNRNIRRNNTFQISNGGRKDSPRCNCPSIMTHAVMESGCFPILYVCQRH